MSDRGRRLVLSIWVFVIPAAIVLLSVGTLNSGAGANAAPGAVSSTGTQQSGSTTTLGGQTAKSDGCLKLREAGTACDCSNYTSCQCEDGACVGTRKQCNTKSELITVSKGALTATRVKKPCSTVFPCIPWIDPNEPCGLNNPCTPDLDNGRKSQSTYYDWKVSGVCGGIITEP